MGTFTQRETQKREQPPPSGASGSSARSGLGTHATIEARSGGGQQPGPPLKEENPLPSEIRDSEGECTAARRRTQQPSKLAKQ